MGEKEVNIIDNETAELEFLRFCEGWEIETDKSAMKEEDQIGFEIQKSQFIRAVKKGRLIYNEDESLTYKFSNKVEKYAGKELIIKRPQGNAYIGMDRFKDQQTMHKAFSILATMTGHAIEYFSNIDGIDIKALQSIAILFQIG
jgi:hypothetical protein